LIMVGSNHGVFSSVPSLPGWSFLQLICGGVLPPPHSRHSNLLIKESPIKHCDLFIGGYKWFECLAAASPTDKL
jgi:hypothetical protein